MEKRHTQAVWVEDRDVTENRAKLSREDDQGGKLRRKACNPGPSAGASLLPSAFPAVRLPPKI